MSRSMRFPAPSVDHRLQAWEEIQQRLHQEPQLKLRPTLTLSRSFGCEGFPVAERARQALEKWSGEPWNIYDKSLLEAVGKEEGVAMRVMKNLGLTAGRLEGLGLLPREHYEQVRAFDAVGKHIVQVASGGNAIIVGRGGAVLCAAMKNAFHFRLDAPFAWRVQSIMERMQLGRAEAEDFVTANSKAREAFMRDQLKADPADPFLFDAVFNNARHRAEDVAAAIVAYVQQCWPSVK